jgi:hypothetical protein
MTGPRDWDNELAAIDRAIEHSPLPAPEAAAPAPGTPRSPVVRGSGPRAWARLGLVLALALALPFWPYARACGLGLLAYLGAVGVLVAAGVWAAANAWRHRRPVAHVLALGAIAWGAALAAGEVLPRVGYARIAATWTC